MRVGIGYDIHRLKKGRKLILGGVAVPHPKWLWGHSDGDVLIHAVVVLLHEGLGVGVAVPPGVGVGAGVAVATGVGVGDPPDRLPTSPLVRVPQATNPWCWWKPSTRFAVLSAAMSA
jgi:hypothetical protein